MKCTNLKLLLLASFFMLLFSCQKTLDNPLPPDPIDPAQPVTRKLIPVKFTMNGDGEVYYDSLVYDVENHLIEDWTLSKNDTSKTVYTYKNNQPASQALFTFPPEKLIEKSTFSDKVNNVVTETNMYIYSNSDPSNEIPITLIRTYQFNNS